MMWWDQTKEIALLTGRLKSAEESICRYQRYAEIHYQAQLVMQRELTNAHAALRRKGKALKILHKRIQDTKATPMIRDITRTMSERRADYIRDTKEGA